MPFQAFGQEIKPGSGELNPEDLIRLARFRIIVYEKWCKVMDENLRSEVIFEIRGVR